MALVYAITSDALSVRWPVIMAGATIDLLGTLVAVRDLPFGATYVAWFLTFAPVGTGALLFAWGSEICGDSAEERAILLVWLNILVYIFNAWVPLYAYLADEAPYYKSGYKVNAALWGVYLIGIPVMLWFSKKFPTKRAPVEDAVQPADYDEKWKESKAAHTKREA
ncbi:hypothetical protein PMAA_061250 [Talaromyces marneffei ATCC 18224]|uniref:Uncharacterized protein n=3 Tax=Talaromyces marneffei TaxID=37727 RepID=B6QMX8_TALMQ|nr:hypothetical protein PMAA_061250 [Talaromyces marneffei ATCC 18224]